MLGEAIAIGRRFGDPDIEFLALAHLGGLAGVGRAVQTVTQGSSARRRTDPTPTLASETLVTKQWRSR